MTRLDRIAVVGASLAGLRAAEALRQKDFAGALTLIGAESHLPYDRPPLSKDVLQGTWAPEKTSLLRDEGLEPLNLDLRLGRRAVSLDTNTRHLRLDDGSEVAFDGLVIATGATPPTTSRNHDRRQRWNPTHRYPYTAHTRRLSRDCQRTRSWPARRRNRCGFHRRRSGCQLPTTRLGCHPGRAHAGSFRAHPRRRRRKSNLRRTSRSGCGPASRRGTLRVQGGAKSRED